MEKTIEIPEGYEARIEGNKVILEPKENEDEKTRQELLSFIRAEKKYTPETVPGEHWDRWIAYLEKQKEQKSTINIEHLKSYLLQYLQDASNREDDNEIQAETNKWAKMIIKVLGSVEQKPAEDKEAIEPTPKQDYSGLTDLERAIHRGFLCAGVENVPVGIIKDTAQDCLAQIKPAGWSEEDMRMLGKCIDAASGYYDPKDKQIMKDFLKSLPERFNLQPKQEWSEEDKRKLNRIYEILGYAADDKGFLASKRIIGDKEAIELQDFLKSLRPQLSDEDIKKIRLEEYTKGFNDAAFGGKAWKPSEEDEKNRCPLKTKEIKVGDIITYFRDGKKGIMLVSSFDSGIYPRCKWGITDIDGTAYGDWAPGFGPYYTATEKEKQQLYDTMPIEVKDWLKSLRPA